MESLELVGDSFISLKERAVKAMTAIIVKINTMINKLKSYLGMETHRTGSSSFGGSWDSPNSTSVNDAIIAPGGKIITTDPMDYLIATKTPETLIGSSNGNTYNISPIINITANGDNRDISRQISKEIANEIKRIVKV